MTRYILLLLIFAAVPLPALAQESIPRGACFAGAYVMSDGSSLVIQPSDADNLRYRFLNGVSGKLIPVSDDRYESGEGWSVREPVTLRVSFGACDEGFIRFEREQASDLDGSKILLPATPISFESGDVTLYGELVMPVQRKPRAIVVLQYGGGRVAATKLAAANAPVDFVVVSYGLAVTMLEEDRLEVAQSLRANGYGADVLASSEELHRAAARVMLSRFSEGLDELERLKSAYRNEPWFADLGGDFTSLLTSTPAEGMSEVQTFFDFPYDLAYDPLPTIEKITVPQLWILAGEDTEAPHETTLAILHRLQAKGLPIDVTVFPHAEHGMIAVEQGSEGRRLAGRTAEGYFDLLIDWIVRQGISGDYGRR